MTRPWLYAALALAAMTADRLPGPANAQQICPWGLQIQMQQQAAQLRMQQMQQQQQALAKMQAQVNPYRPPAPQAQPVVRNPPAQMVPRAAPLPKPALNKNPSQPSKDMPPKHVPLKEEPGRRFQEEILTHVNRLEVAVPVVVHFHYWDTLGVARAPHHLGGDGHAGGSGALTSHTMTHTLTSTVHTTTTNTKLVQEKTPMSELMPPTHRPMPVKNAPPALKKRAAARPEVKRPEPLRRENLILEPPAPHARPEADAKEKAGGKPAHDDKPVKLDAKPPLVTLQFACVQCHIKVKVNLNDPVPNRKAPPLPTIVKSAPPGDPLTTAITPVPTALTRCPHAPATSLQQPIVSLPAPAQHPLRAIKKDPSFPLDMPLPARIGPVLARSFTPIGSPRLPMPTGILVSQSPRSSSSNGSSGWPASFQTGVPMTAKTTSATGNSGGLMPRNPTTEWTSPGMPALDEGQAAGEMLLLNPLGEPVPRSSRQTGAGMPTSLNAAPVADGGRSLEVDGPPLPPLPRFALLLSPAGPWNGERTDDDWYAPQLARRQTRPMSAAPAFDPARPDLPPLTGRALLPY